MASYTKYTWIDEVLAAAARYNILTDAGAPIESNVQVNLQTGVAVAGSEMTADRMNNIETGLDAVADEMNLNLLRGENTTVTTAAGAINLTDASDPIQLIDPNGAHRVVGFDEPTADSHQFLIANFGTGFNLQVDLSTDSYYITPGKSQLFIPYINGADKRYVPAGEWYTRTLAQAVTTANISAATNTRYLLDLSGLTANRNIILPSGAKDGDSVELIVTANDINYSAIILGAAGVSINGLSATEWGRLRYKGEHLRLVYGGADNWRVAVDGRARPILLQVAAAAEPAIDVSMGDVFEISGISAAITSMSTNLTSTAGPIRDGQRMTIRFLDDGTPRAITWGASFANSRDISLPSITRLSKWTQVELMYNYSANQFMCTGIVREDASYAGQRVFRPPLTTAVTGKLLVTNTGYWAYLGQVPVDLVFNFVEFYMVTVGAGAQTAEVGLFSTPSAPNKANQQLTKIVATGTVDNLVTPVGVKRNTNAFNQAVPAGTHLWAGIRTALATTQPTIAGVINDFAQGYSMTTATPGALTGAGPWTGVPLAATVTVNHPYLTATLD